MQSCSSGGRSCSPLIITGASFSTCTNFERNSVIAFLVVSSGGDGFTFAILSTSRVPKTFLALINFTVVPLTMALFSSRFLTFCSVPQ